MNKNEFLAKTLEELNQSSNFLTKSLLFSYPSIGFSYSESLPEKALKAALNGTLNSVEECDVIGILCDWSEISEGIFFTVDAMYVDSPKNSPKKFVIKYDEIQDVKYRNELVNIYYSDGRIYTVNHKMYNKENIYFFLKKARSYCLEELSRKKNDADRVIDSTVSGGEAAGVVYGSVSNASTIYLAD
ncbi:MAG: hypothetical protein ACI4TH_02890, partial [Candidatus Ornithomonoglobus sp.]